MKGRNNLFIEIIIIIIIKASECELRNKPFSSEATLLFTLSVRLVQLVRDAMGEIFSASIEDRQLKFLVKIPITYAHLICTLFCPKSVGHALKINL